MYLLRRKISPFSAYSAAMKHQKNNNLSVFVVIFSLILFGLFMYNEDVKSIAEFPFSKSKIEIGSTTTLVVESKGVEDKGIDMPVHLDNVVEEEADDDEEEFELPPEECDLYDGKWVFDDSTHPLYKEDQCEFLTAQVTCMRNGRKDSMYQNWRWQPKGCNLPKSLDWNNPDGIKCAKEISPILNMSMHINVGTDRRLFRAATEVIQSMKLPVHFLNITSLSEYRKDAHTSVYTIRQGKMLTDEQKADPNTYAGCIHRCLPGLPDTWNEFLYTRIISCS